MFSGEWTTLGDVMAVYNVAAWLRQRGASADIATVAPTLARPFQDTGFAAVDWRSVPVRAYDRFVFACGPLIPDEELFEALERFAHCRKVAVGVSIPDSAGPLPALFDRIVARDGLPQATFDLALADGWRTRDPRLGARGEGVALCFVGEQPEYDGACRHDVAQRALTRVADSLELPIRHVDTVLRDTNEVGDIEAGFASATIVLTTRLHGSLLALRNRIPFVAIDQIMGGRKVAATLRRLEWQHVFTIDAFDEEELFHAARTVMEPPFAEELDRGFRRAVLLSNRALQIAGRAILGR